MKKIILTAVGAVLICIYFFGYGKFEYDCSVSSPEINENAKIDISIEKDENSNTLYITQELSKNLYIDAEVFVPPQNQYSTYSLKMVECDPDRLFNIFCPQSYCSYVKEDRGNCIVYHESSGKRLVIYEKDQNVIQYTTYNFNTEDRPMQDIETLMYYYSLVHPQAAAYDLSFMNVEEMETFGSNIFYQLGISLEPQLIKCITLSGQEILDFQEELFGNNNNGLFMTPTSVTNATDTCYLQYNFSFDGLPLFGADEPNVTSYEHFASMQATATIMINADGIQSCMVTCPYVIETASDPKPIINLEKAICLLKEKYDVQILYDSLKYSDIWMEYIPVKREEKVILTPYWCFREINEMKENSLNYFGSAERFNAITGKDLNYGG